MARLKKILFFFALTGWILGLSVHLLSIAGIDIAAKAPYIWLLHVGIFVVWIPAIFILRKNEELKSLERASIQTSFSPFRQFKVFFKNTPTWLAVIAVVGFYYAIINFGLFALSQPYTSGYENGHYFLQNRGTFIKTITEKEYIHYQANHLRGFSGHWIAFYGLAMAMLYPFSRSVDNNNK